MSNTLKSNDTPAPGVRHVIVVFGGQSAEHDVSRVTAAHVIAALDPGEFHVTPIGISTEGKWFYTPQALEVQGVGLGDSPRDPGALEVSGDPIDIGNVLATALNDHPTTVVLPMLHGPLGEDGTIQGLLELSGIAYVGSGVLGSALAMDKAMAKLVLGAAGIPQVNYVAVHEAEYRSQSPQVFSASVVERLGVPCFVKPANMGSSVGVSKATSPKEIESAIEAALLYDQWIVIEEGVTAREIEVAVIGNHIPEASMPGEICPADEFYSYADKYLFGTAELLIPAPLSVEEVAQVRELAAKVYSTLRCEGLARVDFFFEHPGRGFLCSEVNTMPGFTPISMFPKLWQCSGLTYQELLRRLIDLALDKASQRRRNTHRTPTSRGERSTQEASQLGP
jgi:D-alanine--D-alanine ligase